jgi:hypothetical protein
VVEAHDLDSSSYWVEELTSTSEPESVGDKSLLFEHGVEHVAAGALGDCGSEADGW